MRFKSANFSSSQGFLRLFAYCFFFVLSCRLAHASVELSSATANTHNGNYAFYYLTDQSAATIIPDVGYRKWKVTQSEAGASTDEMLLFDVRTTKTDFAVTGSKLLVATLKMSVSGSEPVLVPIAGAGSNGSTPRLCRDLANTSCTAYTDSGLHFAAIFPQGQAAPIRIGIFPSDICSYFFQKTGISAAGCTTSAVTSDSATPIQLTLQFSVVDSGSAAPLVTPDSSDALGFKLYFSTLAIALNLANCTAANQDYFYRPGDTKLVVDGEQIASKSGYTANGSIVPPFHILAVAKENAAATVSDQSDLSASGIFVSRTIYGLVGSVTGVTNSTTSVTHPYTLRLFVKDYAGAIATSPSCDISNAMATGIRGFLDQDACFVATAAYGDPQALPVRWLRKFRDGYLLHHSWGEAFTRWYYSWSPQAADWLREHPFLIPVVGRLLLPAVAVSGAYVLWDHLFPSAEGAEQPYIDEIKRKLQETPENQGSYIDAVRNGLPSPPDEPSLIERVKSQVKDTPAENSSEGYTVREKEKLSIQPSETDPLPPSAIEAVKNGTSELRLRRSGNIHHAAGVHTAVFRTNNITSSKAANDFQTVYGTAWAPEVLLFYEFQPFHSEIFGNFGIVTTLGFSSFRATGRYQKTDIPKPSGGTYGAQTNVPFQFVYLPISIGINYRFNLLQILRPFVEASALLVGIMENREDNLPSLLGLSKAVVVGGGVAFLMDWLSPRSAWTLESESGVKHSYLIARYNVSIPFASSVNVAVSGFYSGLAFEF